MSDEAEEIEYDADPIYGTVRQSDAGPLFDQSEPEDSRIKFSVSLIKDHQKCGARAWGRISKQPQTKGLALVAGIAVHGGIETLLTTGGDPIAEYTRQFYLEAEKNGIYAKGEDAEKKFKEGLKWTNRALKIYSKPNSAGIPFYKRVNPALVETFFRIERQGRLFVGKLDLIHFDNPEIDPNFYTILDDKTNKTLPSQYELDHDIQFSMYDWATYSDPSLPTFGIWPARNVWLHLRGKNVSGKHWTKADPDNELEYKYSFNTKRTIFQVEREFTETIDVHASQMEQGIFPRDAGEACKMCPFFNKVKAMCTVDLPTRTLIHEQDGTPVPEGV